MKLVEPTLRMSNARVIERVHAPRFLYPCGGYINFGQCILGNTCEALKVYTLYILNQHQQKDRTSTVRLSVCPYIRVQRTQVSQL